MSIRAATFAFLVLPATAAAHPHVWVDTELTVAVNAAGEITGTEMTWTYDDFFTLLILEDYGLDPDGDGALTEAEKDELMGFDFFNWPEGFEGDLYLDAGGRKIALGHPVPTDIDVVNGRIVSTHTRTVPGVAADGAVLRQYDPTYYVSYTLSDITVTGRCSADATPPEADAGEVALAQALESYSEDQFEILQLGIHYADTIRIACARSS